MPAEYLPILFGDRHYAIQRVTLDVTRIEMRGLFDEKHLLSFNL